MEKSVEATKISIQNSLPFPDTISDIVEHILNDINKSEELEFFWGGSRRFDTNNPHSDYDIFILCNTITARKIKEIFRASLVTDNSYFVNRHYRTNIFGFQIDLILFEQEDLNFSEKVDYSQFPELVNNSSEIFFYLLQGEHLQVQDFLNRYPVLKEYMKKLKCKGAEKYRALVKIMLYNFMT
ncbi:MAG: hypothetical protein AABY07_10230 [Nanoarchaeota archaeon]